MKFDVTEHQLQVYTVALDGRIDASTTPQLKDLFKSMTREGKCNVVLDLTSVSFIDSTGMGMLISLLRASTACGGNVRLVSPTGSPIYKILSMVGFEKVFELYNTPEQARQGFNF